MIAINVTFYEYALVVVVFIAMFMPNCFPKLVEVPFGIW